MLPGVIAPEITNRPAAADELLVLRNRTVGRQSIPDLGRQLAATAPLRYLAGTAPIFDTVAELAAAVMPSKVNAWVIADPDPAQNGIHRWTGAAWEWVLPLLNDFIFAFDTGEGTDGVIQATSMMPVTEGVPVWLRLAAAYEQSPLSVSFNGAPAVVIKTNTGVDITPNGTVADMTVQGMLVGNVFRLVTDQISASIVADAEAVLASFKTFSLGAFEEAPTTDLEGNPLRPGAQYFNLTSNLGFTWSGLEWIAAALVNTSAPQDLSLNFAPRSIIDKLNDYVSIFDFPGATLERLKPVSLQDWAPIMELAGRVCSQKRRCLYFPSLHDLLGNPIPYMLRSISSTDIGIGADNAIAIKGNHIHWVAEAGARFKADADAFDGLTITNLFGMITDPFPAGDINSYWGVFDFDVDTKDVNSSGSGVCVWDIYGYDRVEGTLSGDAGYTAPVGDDIGCGGTDTFFSPHSCNNINVRIPRARGYYDAAVYISGNNDGGNINDRVGSYAHFEGYFERCNIAITAKRDAWNLDIGPIQTWECTSGVQASPADSRNNHGKVWNVYDYDMRRTPGRALFFAGGKKTIVGAGRVVDFGLRLSDQTQTSVTQYNWIAAIGFYGEIDPQVPGGYVIGFEDWVPPVSQAANREIHAIVFGTNTVAGASAGTTGAVVGAGRIDRVYRAVIETNESSNNMVTDYVPTNVTADDVIAAVTTVVRRKLLRGARGYGPPSLPATGGRDIQTMAVAGARLGDFVENISFDQDLQGVVLSGWISAAGTLSFQMLNETTAVRALPAGNIRALVRPR